MRWQIIIRLGAEEDLQAAEAWYESQRVGLGDELVEAFRLGFGGHRRRTPDPQFPALHGW